MHRAGRAALARGPALRRAAASSCWPDARPDRRHRCSVFAPEQSLPLAFAPLPLLVWAALRFDIRVVAWQLLAFSVLVHAAHRPRPGAVRRRVADGRPSPRRSPAPWSRSGCSAPPSCRCPSRSPSSSAAPCSTAVSAREELFRRNFTESLTGMLLLRPRGDRLADRRRQRGGAADARRRAETRSIGRYLDRVLDDPTVRTTVLQSVISGRAATAGTAETGLADRPGTRVNIAVSLLSGGARAGVRGPAARRDRGARGPRPASRPPRGSPAPPSTPRPASSSSPTWTARRPRQRGHDRAHRLHRGAARRAGRSGTHLVAAGPHASRCRGLASRRRRRLDGGPGDRRRAPGRRRPAADRLEQQHRPRRRRRPGVRRPDRHRRDRRAAAPPGWSTTCCRPSITTALVGIDARGRITLFNSGAQHLLGYDADELRRHARSSTCSSPSELAERTGARRRQPSAFAAPGRASSARRREPSPATGPGSARDGARHTVSMTMSIAADDVVGRRRLPLRRARRHRAAAQPGDARSPRSRRSAPPSSGCAGSTPPRTSSSPPSATSCARR